MEIGRRSAENPLDFFSEVCYNACGLCVRIVLYPETAQGGNREQ